MVFDSKEELFSALEKLYPEAHSWLVENPGAVYMRRALLHEWNVGNLLIWGDTPQGHKYWSGIHAHLSGLESLDGVVSKRRVKQRYEEVVF